MSDRGVDFITSWVSKHLSANFYPPDGEIRAEAYFKQCISDAQKAGIPQEEIVEDIGDIETYILEAMDDAVE